MAIFCSDYQRGDISNQARGVRLSIVKCTAHSGLANFLRALLIDG
jgi:hypothetical protein